jgi:hypothetical protein
MNDRNGDVGSFRDEFGALRTKDRTWLVAGARIDEIIARKLTLKHRIERLVWSRQIENL